MYMYKNIDYLYFVTDNLVRPSSIVSKFACHKEY
jgi:hypothetical protein